MQLRVENSCGRVSCGQTERVASVRPRRQTSGCQTDEVDPPAEARGNRTLARAWRGQKAFFWLGVARAWRGHGAGVARACPVPPGGLDFPTIHSPERVARREPTGGY
eukprot:gene20279-biopygen11586